MKLLLSVTPVCVETWNQGKILAWQAQWRRFGGAIQSYEVMIRTSRSCFSSLYAHSRWLITSHKFSISGRHHLLSITWAVLSVTVWELKTLKPAWCMKFQPLRPLQYPNPHHDHILPSLSRTPLTTPSWNTSSSPPPNHTKPHTLRHTLP